MDMAAYPLPSFHALSDDKRDPFWDMLDNLSMSYVLFRFCRRCSDNMALMCARLHSVAVRAAPSTMNDSIPKQSVSCVSSLLLLAKIGNSSMVRFWFWFWREGGSAIEIDSSIIFWREEIGNRNRLFKFGGKRKGRVPSGPFRRKIIGRYF